MLNKLKNSLVLVDQAVFSGGSFLTTMLLARLLSVSDFGFYSSILIFVYGAVSILNALVIQPLQVSLEKVDNKEGYEFFTLTLQLVSTLLLIVGIKIINDFEFDFFKSYKSIISESLLFLIGFITLDYFRKLFLAKGNVNQALIIDSISVFFTILTISICFYFKISFFQSVIYYLGLSYIPAIIISFIFIKIKIKFISKISSYFKFQFKQAIWLVLTTITQWWSSNLFVVASGFYLGIEALGAFRLVQSIFGLLNLVLQTFENFVLPETSRKLSISRNDAKKYLLNISKKAGLLFLLVLSILFIFSEQSMYLFGGQKFIQYSYVIKGMSVLYLFIFIGYPIRLSIRLLLLNKLFFIGYVIALIISATTFKYLLSSFGISGAVIGLILSQLATMIFWQYRLYKEDFILWK
jgi:O-antigen/teichoic acid export membrane protein